MKIAEVLNKGKNPQEFILVLSKTESRILMKVLTEYCEQNKRQQAARKLFKELETNLSCY
jgi:hypothetical protein